MDTMKNAKNFLISLNLSMEQLMPCSLYKKRAPMTATPVLCCPYIIRCIYLRE